LNPCKIKTIEFGHYAFVTFRYAFIYSMTMTMTTATTITTTALFYSLQVRLDPQISKKKKFWELTV